MGVNTVGFIATENTKDVFRVCDLVETSLYSSGKAKDISSRLVPSLSMVVVSFKWQKEDRNLHVFFSCGGDYKETYKENKIIFSLGHWGDSERIIKTVGRYLAHNLKKDFYFCPSDTSECWKKNP